MQVAVKRTVGPVASFGRRCARKEASLLQLLQHRNIVQLVAVGKNLRHTDLMLELCELGSLHDLLQNVT